MYQARYGCFETNSSSTHGIALLTAQELKQFELGNLYVNFSNLHELPRCGTFECYKALILNPDDKYDHIRGECYYEYKVNGDTVDIYEKLYNTNKLDKLEGEDLDEVVDYILRANGVYQANSTGMYGVEDDLYTTPGGEEVMLVQADWES